MGVRGQVPQPPRVTREASLATYLSLPRPGDLTTGLIAPVGFLLGAVTVPSRSSRAPTGTWTR